MKNNEELVEKLRQENEEFRLLFEEHQALEKQLDGLNRRRYLTPEEEVERKVIQKQKLVKKDRMAAIIREYGSVG